MTRFLDRLRFGLCQPFVILIITTSLFGSELNQKTPVPEIERKSFLNGMEVLFFEGNPNKLPFLLMIKNGAAFDPLGKWGATYLMTRMIMESLDEQYITSELTGVVIDYRVEWDAIYIFGTAPQDKLEGFLIELARVLTRPEYRREEFERIRAEVLEEVAAEENSASWKTRSLFFSTLFGDNPYSHLIKGTKETLNGLYFRDIKIQSRKLLMPNQTKLALFYPGDRGKFFRNLSRHWGVWIRHDPAPFTFRKSLPLESSRILLLSHSPDDSQAFLRIGFLGVRANSQHAVTLLVLKEYLTLALPDWAQEIANDSQLQGNVELSNRKMPGYLLVSIRCRPDLAAPYLERFRREIQDLLEGRVDERRFAEAKMIVTQQFSRHLEDPSRSLDIVLKTDLYELGIHYIVTFGLRIQRITPGLFLRGIGDSFNQGNFLAVISTPTLEIRENLALLAPVEVLN